MESLTELYRIGRGPSSSHTIAPDRAARIFLEENPDADRFIVTLYGSLSKTGKGHMTDTAIVEVLGANRCHIVFSDRPDTELPHPNTMFFEAFDVSGACTASMEVYSVGGGRIAIKGRPAEEAQDIYTLSSFSAIRDYCGEKDLRLCEYVYETEGDGIRDYLAQIWNQMKATVERGLAKEGLLQGGLDIERKARYLYRQNHIDETPQTRENRLVCAFAYAVSEENADGGIIVTAPTCGASGVVPATLYYMQKNRHFSDEQIIDALATAGIVGNLIKTNASISGAECGCQAEVGSACSMAAAGLAELFGMEINQIEYAAEVAMEHHLGLTCDPICGLVQIPCIERNAVAAMRAINALSLANFLTHTRKISFDMVIKTMYETGRDLFSKYRETSEGGLAKNYFE
ncbi:MAG: L-serine ammonia-lyase [Firmicutes bacterium]|nr:L-serine ammonia-lyase [Bacillota bacterium]